MTAIPFHIRQDNIYAVPIIHYNMEVAAHVRLLFEAINPDCIAVELPETMQLQFLHAASRLPDISVVVTNDCNQSPLFFLAEPCDASFEALRSALEAQKAAFCIDLDVASYPEMNDPLPDPYSIFRIGLEKYFTSYQSIVLDKAKTQHSLDKHRETYMAMRLKELSLSYEKVLFISGMSHIKRVLSLTRQNSFPNFQHVSRDTIQLCTLSEDSCRDVMAEFGYISTYYEKNRVQSPAFPPDRQKLIYQLYRESAEAYKRSTGNNFAGYHLRNTMKFVRNYALITGRLMPDLFQVLSAAKSCVDHNFAYETWLKATEYPYLKNIDNLPELDLSIEDVWGRSKLIRFHIPEPSRKKNSFHRRKKDRTNKRFEPPGPFGICSYPPEDLIVENFGRFLKKKGVQILSEEAARTVAFSSSLEDGIDTRETIRHWHEHTLYVKIFGKPPGDVGSIVIVFDEDQQESKQMPNENYPWKTTWLGEHEQESDMAFYATHPTRNVVGPGISRCEYGGFMMSYPPRRMWDIWVDPDYDCCRSKPEVLLMAAIDYAVKPVIVYVACSPPRSFLKSFAKRFGKKIVYLPIGQLSAVTLNKIRVFHVLDGYDKRKIADEYIF